MVIIAQKSMGKKEKVDRFYGVYGGSGFNGGGAAHKNIEAPRSFETGSFLIS
jgi:hypothetical protein